MLKIRLLAPTLLCLTLGFLLQNFAFAPHPNKTTAYQIKKIVLDAGHGGKDPGCIGSLSREKHNALAVVLRLGALIQQNLPEVEVIYTRSTDVFIELKERAAIANREDADVFISVHCNSVGAAHIKGTETYVMGLHTAQSNLTVAKRENSAIYLEDNYQNNYDGYDPNSPEAHILGSVWQSAYLEQSILLASFVQKYAHSIAERKDMGVKQAGFLVLRETAMPSILVETGYLTNGEEERFLASEEGQQQMALSVFEAFRDYKDQMEGGTAVQEPTKPAEKTSNKTTSGQQKNSTSGGLKTSQASTSTAPKAVGDGIELLRKAGVKSAAVLAEPKPVLVKSAAPKPKTIRILIATSNTKLDLNQERYQLLPKIEERRVGQEYQYLLGHFDTRQTAEREVAELRNLGFKKASVVETE